MKLPKMTAPNSLGKSLNIYLPAVARNRTSRITPSLLFKTDRSGDGAWNASGNCADVCKAANLESLLINARYVFGGGNEMTNLAQALKSASNEVKIIKGFHQVDDEGIGHITVQYPWYGIGKRTYHVYGTLEASDNLGGTKFTEVSRLAE